jgi:hypothetical protein
MRFLEIIIENSTEKFAKLYNPAYKASQNPDNGITIQNKSAYHVIKDCAYIAHLYLPIYVFEQYIDPFNQLKGKFKRSDIEEVVESAKTKKVNDHLLNLILSKAEKNISIESKKDVTTSNFEPNDPYGEYGMEVSHAQTLNTTNSKTDTLCELFNISN